MAKKIDAAYFRRWRRKNPNASREAVRRWRLRHPTKAALSKARWRKKNKKHVSDYAKRWRVEKLSDAQLITELTKRGYSVPAKQIR